MHLIILVIILKQHVFAVEVKNPNFKPNHFTREGWYSLEVPPWIIDDEEESESLKAFYIAMWSEVKPESLYTTTCLKLFINKDVMYSQGYFALIKGEYEVSLVLAVEEDRYYSQLFEIRMQVELCNRKLYAKVNSHMLEPQSIKFTLLNIESNQVHCMLKIVERNLKTTNESMRLFISNVNIRKNNIFIRSINWFKGKNYI